MTVPDDGRGASTTRPDSTAPSGLDSPTTPGGDDRPALEDFNSLARKYGLQPEGPSSHADPTTPYNLAATSNHDHSTSTTPMAGVDPPAPDHQQYVVFASFGGGSAEEDGTLTYQIAKTYVPFLSSSSYEKICQEPTSLRNELHFLQHEIENLASQNVGSFLENTTLVANITNHDFPALLGKYRALTSEFEDIQKDLEDLEKFARGQGAEREAYRNILQKYNVGSIVLHCSTRGTQGV